MQSIPDLSALQVKLCLVINKLDRLIQELHLTPAEAYERQRSIVTHVNMIISSFQSEQFINEADAVLAHEAALASGAGGSRCVCTASKRVISDIAG